MEYFITLLFTALAFFALYKIKMYGARGISKHWFAAGFGLKLLAAAFMLWFYALNDRNKADIFRFYDDSQVIANVVFSEPMNYLKMLTGIDGDNPELTKYYKTTNNWDYSEGSRLFSNNRFIIRYLSVLSLLTLGSYGGVLVITVFFAFTGLFWVFRFFYSRLLEKKWLIFGVVFFSPSLLFWTSGLLKESLLMGFIGLIFNCGGFALKGRQPIPRLIMLLLALLFIFQIRAIIAALLILVILPYVWNHYRPKQYAFISYFIFFFMAISFASESDKIISKGVYEMIIQKKMAFEHLALAEGAGSFIATPQLKPHTFSFIKNSPSALVNVLFRPFPWEANNPMMWMALCENVLLLGAIIFAILFYRKNITIYNLLWLSLLFAISYFLIIGLSVPVLGAISRYRVIPLLFFELALVQIIDIEKIRKKYIS